MLVRDINSITTGSQDSRENQQARSEAAALFGDYYNQIADQYRFPSGEGGFGTSPDGWNKPPVGPIIVVRADSKPLLSQHLKVICDYVEQKVEPRLQEAMHGLAKGAYIGGRERVLDSVNKTDFLAFWSTHETARGASGGPTPGLPSPYDLQGHTLERLNARTESLWLSEGMPTVEVRRLQPGGSGGPTLEDSMRGLWPQLFE